MPKRLLQSALLILVLIPMLGAGAPSSRFDALGHKLMCVCGCGQILLECNHVGCPDSDREITELRAQLASGLPDERVLGWFINKYGPTVLAAPLRGGFDTVAWIVPFAALGLGLTAVILFIRRWRRRQLHAVIPEPHSTVSPEDAALRDRIRRETTF
jgi:cytochrome c-type biogenesis protein CcmH/NrfF